MPNEVRGAEGPPGMRDLSTNEGRSASATARRTVRGRRRARRGALAIVSAASVLVLTAALAACASTKSVGPAAAGGTLTGAPVTSPTPSASASASASGGSGSAGSGSASPGVTSSVNPGGPAQGGGGQLGSPEAQASTLPAGAHYVPIEQIGRSADGRTLYLEIEAQAGACGRYVVVVQESASQVAVGLAHLPVKVGVMCPMLVRIADFPAHLSAPLGNRPVIDLASGRAAGGVGVIPLPLPGSVNSGVTSNR
ncbi:MAG TPA: hypothetical protein VGZ32_11945 [Actinocrinis sp.]|uniref:hypothetical protein n=1 Tax=Actinocrinis sp. TaxID=1920516 RepID=UPI002DDDB8BF|nr:hypothetical protein [Actinocrinis sp.]HEV3171049.1 hypothetical protein [Actinocrinis sp.]